MSHPRRKYDPDFRAGAVRIVRETRRPIAEIARELGIGSGVLGLVAVLGHRGDRGGGGVGGAQSPSHGPFHCGGDPSCCAAGELGAVPDPVEHSHDVGRCDVSDRLGAEGVVDVVL